MDSWFLGIVIAFSVGVLVGRLSTRSRANRLEAQLRQAQDVADENFNDYAALVVEYNELVDDYNEAIRPKSKPKPKTGGSKASVASSKEVDAPSDTSPKAASPPSAPKPRSASIPVAPAASQPIIVTRTSTLAPGMRALDNWSEKSDWLAAEDAVLKSQINNGQSVASIAIAMGIDQKDVAYRATRLYFHEWSDLDDKANAPFDGTTWTKSQKMQFDELVAARKPLGDITKRLGRTKIAIGWRMIDTRKMRF